MGGNQRAPTSDIDLIIPDIRRAPLGVRFKLLYGTGAMVEGITTTALTYFLLFYLTSVCGLSGTVAGTVMLVGLLIDGVADPLIGLLSDNSRSRHGRRLPWMAWSIVPLAIVFGLLFTVPTSLGGVALICYALLCAAGVRVGQSLFNLPYVAVGAEVTDDYDERSSVVSYRVTFSMVGVFLTIGLGLGVFMSGTGGVLSRPAYIGFGWTCAVVIALAGLGGIYATRGVRSRLHVTPPGQGPMLRRFLLEFRDIFRNRSFVVLFLGTLAFFVAQGMAGSLALYLNGYFWKLPAAAVQLVLVGATLGPFIGIPVNIVLTKRIDKKTLTIANFLVFVVGQLWAPLARIAGVFPTGETAVVTILFCNALLTGAALVGAAIGAQSMMADAVDEHEHLFGIRREGLFFSGLALAVKAASGLGGFLAGAALDLIHFPTGIAGRGGTLHLSTTLVRNLGLIAGPLPAAITLLAPLALLGYALSRDRHAEILTQLQSRRAG